MQKKWLALGTAAALAVTAGCGAAESSPVIQPDTEPVSLTVSEVARSVFYAPQYAAQTQGFFEEEGLLVAFVTDNGADKVMTAVVSGQADIGFSGPEACIYVANEGKADHAVVFAQLTKRDGAFLVGREPSDGEFDWESLRGAQLLGGRAGGVPLMTLEYVLRQKGLDPDADLEVDSSIQFALMAGAFTGGQGDYVALFEPTASSVEREGKGYVLASVGEESGELPYTCYYANKSYLAEHADTVQAFTNAIYKGQQWVQAHSPEEIADAIAPFFPDTDRDLLVSACARHKEIDAFAATPVLEQESFERLQDIIEQAGELTQRAEFSEIVDNTFAEQAVSAIG
jgi:NitT/TauT family transport system substrate-binding protein